MNLPDFDTDLEEIMKDPDRRARFYLYFAIARILITLAIPIGVIIFILLKLNII